MSQFPSTLLVDNMKVWLAIIWSNVGMLYWCIYVSQGLNELKYLSLPNFAMFPWNFIIFHEERGASLRHNVATVAYPINLLGSCMVPWCRWLFRMVMWSQLFAWHFVGWCTVSGSKSQFKMEMLCPFVTEYLYYCNIATILIPWRIC